MKLIIMLVFSLIVSCSNTSNLNNESLNDTINEIRTDKDIQLEFQRTKGEIHTAFDKFRLHDEMEIIYRISINPNGNVIKSEVKKSTSKNNKIDKAINDIILKMNFNKVKNQDVYTFDFPLKYLPY